jgi:hypothetical protein
MNNLIESQQSLPIFSYGYKRDSNGQAFPESQRKRMSESAKRRVAQMSEDVKARIQSTEDVRRWIKQIYDLLPTQLAKEVCDLRGLHLKSRTELTVIYKRLITTYEDYAD